MPCSRFNASNMRRISTLVCESRLPVGSSARRNCGRLISARAMATRCCWPPESCEGSWSMRSPRSTRLSSSIARWRVSRSVPVSAEYPIGIITFSSALVRGSRLNVWKTKPIMRFRKSARSFADAPEISWPSSQYWPEVGWSRQPRMFIKVLLPEPLTPMSATSSPRSMDSDIALQHRHVNLAEVIGLVDVLEP